MHSPHQSIHPSHSSHPSIYPSIHTYINRYIQIDRRLTDQLYTTTPHTCPFPPPASESESRYLDVKTLPFEHGVSLTALWSGYHRMQEGITAARPLFYDGLAKDLMGEANATQAFQRMQDALEGSFVVSKAAYTHSERVWFSVRTRYYDDMVQCSLLDHTVQAQQRQGGARPRQLQVVDMACGFDARAFRLTFPPDTVFFEVDRAEVLGLKATRLDAVQPAPVLTCARRVCIPADILLDDWEARLVEQGFDPALPACWLMEGIFIYLDEEQAVSVLRRIQAISVPGSTLAFDCVNEPIRFIPNMQRRLSLLAEDHANYRLFLSWPHALMARAGFAAEDVAVILPGDDPRASFGRAGPCPFLQAMRIVIRVVIALIYVGAGLLLGLFIPYYAAIPALLALILIGEAWAVLYKESLARQLKLIFYPCAYMIEARL